jgi:lysyl-tRNA synthetase, class II
MEALLIKYGYALLFGGVIVEGEAFLLAGAYMAHKGYFNLLEVIAVGVAATMLGDQVYFRAARARGRAWVERRKGSRAKYAKILELTERRGPWLILASRWTFGMRMVIPAACGATGMSVAKFTAIDFVSVSIWATALTLLGYYGGSVVEGYLKQVVMWGVLGVLLSGAAVFGVRRLQKQGRVKELGWADLHAIVPFVMGLLGVFNIVAAVWPDARAFSTVGRWLPLDVQGHRVVVLFAGLALLQVTRNLARRKELAWWIATAALALSVASHIGQDFQIERAIVPGLLLAYLLAFKRRFSAQSDPATLRWAFVTAPLLGLAIVAYGTVGLRHLRGQYEWARGTTAISEAVRGGILIAKPAIHPRTVVAERFYTSLQIAGWLARLYLLVLLLRPVMLRVRQELPPEDLERIRAAYASDALAAFALRPDKHQHSVAEGRGLVAFAVRNAVAVACGDPLCAPEDMERAASDFVEHAGRHGWTPCVYGASDKSREAYAAAGLKAVRIAEEVVVHLPDGIPEPDSNGLVIGRYDQEVEENPALEQQVLAVSDEWLQARDVGELHFTIGSLDPAELKRRPVFIAQCEDRVEALCGWLPYRAGRGMALDLLRRRESAPPAARRALLLQALHDFRDAGAEEASLGLTPAPAASGGRIDRGLAALAERLGAIYTYDALATLQEEFRPARNPRYLLYRADRDLPRITVAVVEAHTRLHETHPLARLMAAGRAAARWLRRRRPGA